jgi:Tol biopolymer transport system component
MTIFTGTNGSDTANATTSMLSGFSGGTLAQLRDSIGDLFNAGDGADTIVGGGGNDTLIGGDGSDLLTGDGMFPSATVRVSTTSGGVQGTGGDSFEAIFSPDGTKLLFTSDATDLVAGDTNLNTDVFIKDLITGTITRISTSSSNAEASGGYSREGVFSPDGTKVVFASNATNLVAGDTNGSSDIFMKNLVTGTVIRVSTNAAGTQAIDGGSLTPVFSPDGTKIVFVSDANNLVPGGTQGDLDIFIKDLVTGVVTLVSTSSSGAQGSYVNGSFNPVFSPDGTKVAFVSDATNFIVGDTNGFNDIFIKDLLTGVATRVSTTSSNAQATGGNSSIPVFSPDGTKLLFTSNATNLVSGDTNGQRDIFIKDLLTGAVTRVSTDSANGQAIGGESLYARFSPDSTRVLFQSVATNLVAGDTNGQVDIFVKDLVTGAVTRVSTDTANGQSTGGGSFQAVFSPDGTQVAFNSSATNLVSGDTNGQADIFIRTIGSIGNGADSLDGGAGNDTLNGGAGADTLDGGTGFDTASYANSATSVQVVMYNTTYNTGEAAGDVFRGIEAVQGSANIDILVGDFGLNAILGGAGGDWIDGTYGGDYLYGEAGNDSLVSRQQADVLDGGVDFDYARYDYADAGLRAFLYDPSQNTGWAAGDTYVSIEGLAGSYFADDLRGDANQNIIYGLGGADFIVGLGGSDLLIGGNGQDLFHFVGIGDGGPGGDAIQDFVSGQDRISVTGAFFGLGSPGGVAIDSFRFVSGAAATLATSQFIYNGATRQLFYDIDGTGAGVQVLLATLQVGATMAAGDILVL